MVPQQEQKYESPPRHIKRSRMHWIVVSIAILASVVFAAAAILILINESIPQAPLTLTILSVIVGGLIGLFSLMFNFLQWFNARPSGVPNASTPSISSSQSSNDRNVAASPTPVSEQLSFPPQTTPRGIIEISATAHSRIAHQSEQTIKEKDATEPKLGDFYQEDWGEAPHIDQFYGREKELAELEQWIVSDRCRLVAVLGMGGVGKTTLVEKLAEQIKDDFDYIFWRTLQNAPLIESILKDYLQFLSHQQLTAISNDMESQIILLLQYFRNYRCLFVLDNLETVVQAGNHTGQYREGYKGYGRLIQRIGEMKHQSCLLLTSREKPKEIAHLEGKTLPIRSLLLSGLEQGEGQKLLKDKGLFGSEEACMSLIRLYSGNPLALKLVSEPIREVFGGDVTEFLKGGEIFVGEDVHDLLDQQFQRLSGLEREIMYWLAIEREVVSLDTLQEDIVWQVSRTAFLDALRSLRQRSMIESLSVAIFTLQPVIMEYVTNRFVERVIEEIETETIELFESHALIKAQAKDYVRDSQTRLILMPITKQLHSNIGKEGIEKKLKNILSILRVKEPQKPGYAAGNSLNMLIHLQSNLRDYDFSHLTIWQAYLQHVDLPGVSFAYSNLARSVFTETFGIILSIAFSPDGELLAAGTANGDILLWQTSDGIPFLTFQGTKDWIRSVAFSPDGQLLASGSNDHTISLWEVSTGKCLKIFYGHTGWVWPVAFSPDGSMLASGSSDQTVRLWEVSTGQCLKILEGHTHWVFSVAFNLDGTILASGSGDQTIRLWEVSTGDCVQTLEGHTDRIVSIAFSPDGSKLVSSGNDQTVRLWEAGSGQCLRILLGHHSWVRSVAFNPNGSTIASGSDDQTIRLWEVSTSRCLHTFQGHDNEVISVAFSPDGSTIASGNYEQTIRLWEVSTGQCLHILQGHTHRIWSVAFSPDGRLLASGSHDQTIRLWETNSGQCLQILQELGHRVYSVAFSPDGSIIASGGDDQTVRLWEVSTGQCLHILRGHTNLVKSVAFSPDGSELASSGEEQTMRLWEVSTGQCLKTLEGNSQRIYSVAFSPDGTMLASGNYDQTVRLWEASSGQCLKVLEGHTQRVYSVAFSPDGASLASGSADGIIKYWDAQTGICLKTLRSDKPYEHMNISNVTGLTDTQKATLRALGAIENK